MQARKTMAMISGHVHSYERFTRAEKTFLVTGGGGARSKVYTDWRRRHLDDGFDGPSSAAFTFLLTPLSTRLEIEMRGLQQRHGGLRRWTTSPYPGRQALCRRDHELPGVRQPVLLPWSYYSWVFGRTTAPTVGTPVGWRKLLYCASALPRRGGRTDASAQTSLKRYGLRMSRRSS